MPKADLNTRLNQVREAAKAAKRVTVTAAPDMNPVAVAPPAVVIKTKEEGLALIPPLQAIVERLTITTDMQYQQADGVLAKIRQARSSWSTRMERIIRPIRQGLDELYSLNRDVDKPLERMEISVKAEMREYKLLESKRLAEEQAERDREAARLRREIEEREARAAAATTKAMQRRLEEQRRQLEQREAEVITTIAEPVKGAQSATRTVKRWRVHDLQALVNAAAEGQIPLTSVIENRPELQKVFQTDPEGFAAWPGVEVYDDIVIAGR